MAILRFYSCLAITVVLVQAFATKQLNLPIPTGPYKVGQETIALVDKTRKDTFAPSDDRSILVTVFYPSKSKGYQTAPYVSPVLSAAAENLAAFPNGTLLAFRTNSYVSTPVVSPKDGGHILFFSPGQGSSRLFDTAVFEDAASHGYSVITIDHPYDSVITEFPDGRVIPAITVDSLEVVLQQYEQRVQDILFLSKVDTLKKIPSIKNLLPRKGAPKIGVFGHSLGGAAAAGALLAQNGSTLAGGINFDGGIQGAAATSNIKKPFINFGRAGHTDTDPTWQPFKAAQKGWFKMIAQAKSGHWTFTDVPVIVDIAQLRNYSGFPPDFEADYIGTIDGHRATEIQRRYVRDFFGWLLCGGKGTLVNGPSAEFPEITFV